MTTTYPRRVVVMALLLLLSSIASIATTRFEADIFKLFPSQAGPLKLFLDSLEWTGGAKDVYFLLEGEPSLLPVEAERLAARLKTLQVDGATAFRNVKYRVYDTSEAASFARFIAYAVTHPQLYLDPAEAGNYGLKFDQPAINKPLDRAGAELASQVGMGMRDIIAADPLYLRELILPRLKKASQALALDTTSPYFLSRDGQVLIMIAEPALPVQNIAFARKLVAGIEEVRRGMKVNVSCAGAHLSAVIDERVMKENIIACIVSSLIVVLGLFYLTYRRVLPTLLIPLILFYGVALALGTAGLFLSSISIISFAFTALIIGLGTDYSIHLYDRYYSERSLGRDTAEAMELAIVETGHGIFTAAATTALPFLALTISDVRALSELGLLVGLGVIFSLYATFFFLPPFIIAAERRFPAVSYRPLPRFGLGWIWKKCLTRSGWIVGISALLFCVLLVAACFISFEGDLKNLQPRHSEAFLAQEKMEKHLSLSPKQMLVALDGQLPAELMERGGRVETLLAEYQRRGNIVSWSSLGQVLNNRGVQAEVLNSLQQSLAGKRPSEEVRGALQEKGFAPEAFGPFLDSLAGLSHAAPVDESEALDHLGRSPLRGVVERHLIKDKGNYHLLLYINYRGEEFNQQTFLKQLAAIEPSARATSVDLVSEQLGGAVKKSFFWGFLLGGALVLFLLLSHFSSLGEIWQSLFPVVGGVIAMLGLMVLTGMRLNFMNAMVLVTIVGMGSDYGMHVLHRVTAVDMYEAGEQFVQSGRAVLLSALTTIAGFGSLAFTDYGAMSSIGWATNYGIAATGFFALVTLPAMICRHRRS
ncbi:MMPL family transporter [Geotalea toluenoxydans]